MMIKNWWVYWTNKNDGPPALAVWPDTVKKGEIGSLICKITPESAMTDDDVVNAALIASAPAMQRALEKLVFMHSCEQEGISSGQPTPKEWFAAVGEATSALELSKTLPDLR